MPVNDSTSQAEIQQSFPRVKRKKPTIQAGMIGFGKDLGSAQGYESITGDEDKRNDNGKGLCLAQLSGEDHDQAMVTKLVTPAII